MKHYIVKRILFIVFVIGLQLVLMSNMLKLAGAHEASTGAPGEETCAQSGCHSDATVGPGDLVNKLIFNNGDSTYTPGSTYAVKIQATKSSAKRIGFQVTVLKASDNSYVGSLVVTDANRTQLQNGISPNPSRKYITHKTAGAAVVSTGLNEWTFNWKAPSSDVGAVKFYYATNVTNMDNAKTGDQIYLSSFQIKPKQPTGVKEIETVETAYFNAYYSSVNNELMVSFDHLPFGDARIEIRDMTGKLIQTTALGQPAMPVKEQRLSLKEDLAKGIYLVTYRVDNTLLSNKIFVGK
jgi:hypothetical protein